MKLKPFLRPIFECDGRVLRKLAVNMCWRSFWGMREFAKRQKKFLRGEGDFFPAFLMISISDRCNYKCKGCWVFTASSKQAPFVVDSQVQPIIDPTQVYSGMWGNVNVNFFAYNQAGKKGIGCGLNGVQKTADGDPLGSHITAQDAFQAVAPAAPSYPAPPAAPAAPAYPGYPSVNPITGLPW